MRRVALALVVSIAVGLLVRAALQSYVVQGHSMEPTLEDGQHVLVEKASYRLNPPRRGDIVVLRSHWEQADGSILLKRIFAVPGETVQVQGFARTEEGKPLSTAGLTAAVVYPNGSRAPLSPSFFGECHHATFVPDAGGEYLLEVEGVDGDTSLGKFQTKFFVRAADFEMDSPEADLPFLHRAARETGGRYVEPERLGDLLQVLQGRPAESVVEEERRSDLWNRPSVIFLFAAILTLEWVLRRLKRLL